MKETKKGIEPLKENNTQTQLHIIRADNICLALLYGGLILFVYAYTKGYTALWGFGIGLSFAMLVIQAVIDKEDRDE